MRATAPKREDAGAGGHVDRGLATGERVGVGLGVVEQAMCGSPGVGRRAPWRSGSIQYLPGTYRETERRAMCGSLVMGQRQHAPGATLAGLRPTCARIEDHNISVRYDPTSVCVQIFSQI